MKEPSKTQERENFIFVIWNRHSSEKFFPVYGNGLEALGELNFQVCDLRGRQLNFGG